MALLAAVLGTGTWARTAHLPALTATPGVTVAACVDPNLAAAEEAAATFEVPNAFTDLDQLFAAHPDLDLLVVAAPDDAHPAAIRACLERNVAVFCEKPLANDGDEAAELAALAARAQAPATVGYSFRYSPAIQALRTDYLAGILGDIWLVEIAEHNPQFHPGFGRPLSWKGDPEHAAAGALFEYGSHALDLVMWLFGPVTAVSTHLTRILPGARLDDLATCQLRFASGAAGLLVASWVLEGGFPGIRLRVHASRKLADIDLDEALEGKERYRLTEVQTRQVTECPLPTAVTGPSFYATTHLADLIHTIQAPGSATSSPTLPTIGQAAEDQLVLSAALAATESWVDIGPTIT
ncbi:MAG: Gfo/Idh/MocA family oxidoreductase [Bifidobacteriaceae bacterium]|jgi:predicted dehydrogenase|nr:Gfo/Idh/MocA family oxidoreductase [Bifidobacteriaceae bacterium]